MITDAVALPSVPYSSMVSKNVCNAMVTVAQHGLGYREWRAGTTRVPIWSRPGPHYLPNTSLARFIVVQCAYPMKNNASLIYNACLVVGDFFALIAAFVAAYILRVKLDTRPLLDQIHAGT